MRRWAISAILLFAAIFVFVLPARALVADPRVTAQKQCVTDGDCVVKDAGSCCGYMPGCFNRDAVIDTESVRRECEKDGVAGICGFADIQGCACRQGWCTPLEKPITNDGGGQ